MFSLEILIVLSYSVILAGKPAKKKQRRLAETVEKAKEKEKEAQHGRNSADSGYLEDHRNPIIGGLQLTKLWMG